MSAIDYILIILVLASLYLNWHLVQVCRSAMKARKLSLIHISEPTRPY